MARDIIVFGVGMIVLAAIILGTIHWLGRDIPNVHAEDERRQGDAAAGTEEK